MMMLCVLISTSFRDLMHPLFFSPPLPLFRMPSFEQQSFLYQLIVDNNELTQLPTLAPTLYGRRLILGVANNKITSWPTNLTKSQKSKIYRVSLAGNNLTTVPSFVNELTDLWYLDVSNNSITTLDTLATAVPFAATPLYNKTKRYTDFILGQNPACANGAAGAPGRGALKWKVSCEGQCSATCTWSLQKSSCGCKKSKGWLGNGFCNPECNTAACEYDGGDCTAQPWFNGRGSPQNSTFGYPYSIGNPKWYFD